jgi:hypothetical protein
MKQIWTIISEWVRLPLSDRTIVLMLVLLVLFGSVSSYLYKENEARNKAAISELNHVKIKYDSLLSAHVELMLTKASEELRRTDSLLKEANKIKANISQTIKSVKR